jgi:transcriptional regulator NrdR family protein
LKPITGLRRRRACRSRGHRWTTVEVSLETLEAIVAAVTRIDAPRRLRLYADAIERIGNMIAAPLGKEGEE